MEAWALDGRCRLPGTVFGQRENNNTHGHWQRLGCQNLRAQAKAGVEGGARGWVGLWNTLILPEMSNKEVAKLPHMVGASQWRLTHLWVNRTESQLVEKGVLSPKSKACAPSAEGTASQQGQPTQQPVWNTLGLPQIPWESSCTFPWW